LNELNAALKLSLKLNELIPEIERIERWAESAAKIE